jgi:glycosyltransferase involved in cell wall biosynthesis
MSVAPQETPAFTIGPVTSSQPSAPRTRIRIAFVIDAIDQWEAGTERHLRTLLGVLDRQRFEPELYFLRPSLHFTQADFPCPVHVADWRPHVKWYRPTPLWRLVKLFRSRRPHIVQTFFRDGTYYGTLAAKLAGVPAVVVSVRNAGYWERGIDQLPLKVAYRLADFFQCNSRSVAEALINEHGVPSDRISVLPNVIDLSAFTPPTPSERLAARQLLGLAPGAPVFVSVANLRPVKDLFTLIEAAGLVRRELPEARFLLVGEGPLRQALESRVSRLGLNDSAKFLGAQADVRSCLAAADIGVLTSRSESSSKSVLEYMAMELPSVLSGIPGNRDLAEGVFFEPGNASDLADKLLLLWKDQGLREQTRQAYRRKVREHDLATVYAQAQTYYSKLRAPTPATEAAW